MRIGDIANRPVVGVSVGDSLEIAAKKLAEDEIGAVVVFSARGPVGIFSERDLVRAVADGADVAGTPVDDYMTEMPLSVGEHCSIGEAIAQMNEHGMRHVGVRRDGDIVGMVSMRDIVGLLGTHWPEL